MRQLQSSIYKDASHLSIIPDVACENLVGMMDDEWCLRTCSWHMSVCAPLVDPFYFLTSQQCSRVWLGNEIRWPCPELGCSTLRTTQESDGHLSRHQVLAKCGSHRHRELVE